MSTRSFRILAALCGILGVATLITSFLINQGPPPDSTIAQVMVWGKQNFIFVLLGAWLQGIGSLLNVIFVFALVRLANATTWLSGLITMLAGTIILAVSLTECTFYLSADYGGASGDMTTLSVSLILIKAIQHMYFIAPALLLPLGIVILGSGVLPQVFGYLALVIGAVFEILGLVGLFIPFQIITIVVPILVEFWILAAAIILFISSLSTSGQRCRQHNVL
jgi:hypothetical protein